MRRLGESLSYRYFRGNFRLKQRLLFLTHFKTICLVGTVKLWAIKIANKLARYKWNNKKPTIQMLGRYQPFHKGHLELFEKILTKTGQVCIQIKDVHRDNDNPFNFIKVKNFINKKLLPLYKNRYKILLVPNISKICYGRTVGYEFEKISISKKIHNISATKIRAKMREDGKLK